MQAPRWHVTGWDDTMGATVLELGERLYLERCAVGWRLLDQHPIFSARMLSAFVTRPAAELAGHREWIRRAKEHRPLDA